MRLLLLFLVIFSLSKTSFAQEDFFETSAEDSSYKPIDTSYSKIAPQSVINMIKPGKSPTVTIQASFNYNIGHLGLADNENTYFRKDDFEAGKSFGTRYGFGFSITGKFTLHQEGNMRVNVGAAYNKLLSNFVIEESPEGKVHYNTYSALVGIENNFSPDKKIKPYIGLDIVTSKIIGEALFKTDSTDFILNIRSATRFGVSINMGVEYAFSDHVGINLGYRITHANIIGRENKEAEFTSETYLNDAELPAGSDPIMYAGSKVYMFSTIYAGFNIYIGMKNKK